MKSKANYKRLVVAIASMAFVLFISNNIVKAEDASSSPLFRESLENTLQEFESGTRRLGGTSENSNSTLRERVTESKRNDRTQTGDHRLPTLSGSTCRGGDCQIGCRFPTMVGSTCSVTCGRRSTCAGFICRIISPWAKADKPEKVAENKNKSYNVNIF